MKSRSIGMQPIFINKMNFKIFKSGFKNYYLIENKKILILKLKIF